MILEHTEKDKKWKDENKFKKNTVKNVENGNDQNITIKMPE